MVLKNEASVVTIDIDETFTIGSVDHGHHDVILNPFDYKRSDFIKTLAIHIDLAVIRQFTRLRGAISYTAR